MSWRNALAAMWYGWQIERLFSRAAAIKGTPGQKAFRAGLLAQDAAALMRKIDRKKTGRRGDIMIVDCTAHPSDERLNEIASKFEQHWATSSQS